MQALENILAYKEECMWILGAWNWLHSQIQSRCCPFVDCCLFAPTHCIVPVVLWWLEEECKELCQWLLAWLFCSPCNKAADQNQKCPQCKRTPKRLPVVGCEQNEVVFWESHCLQGKTLKNKT